MKNKKKVKLLDTGQRNITIAIKIQVKPLSRKRKRYIKQWKRDNPDKLREYARKWRNKNRAKYNKKMRIYMKRNGK